MKRIICGLAGAVVLSACGGPGKVDGKVGGVKLDVADAIFATLKGNDGKTTATYIVLADAEDICGSLKANRNPKSVTTLFAYLIHTSDDNASLAPSEGDYRVTNNLIELVSPGRKALANFDRTDSNCTSTLSSNTGAGVSGLITLKELKAKERASGTLDITFGSDDKVKGEFSATYCDISEWPTQPNCE